VDALRSLDDRIFFAINSLARHTGWLHAPAAAYATYGVVLFAALLAAGVLIARRGPSRPLAAALWAPVATLLAVALNQPIGLVVREARPTATHPQALLLLAPTTDFSFPSDHSVMAGAVAVGLLLVSRRLGSFAAAAAVLIALARVYVGAHYPWDVVGGLAVGALVTAGGWRLVGGPMTTLVARLRATSTLGRVFPDDAADAPARTASGTALAQR
jgi:membrane-associated phospholipid phosphatase